MKTKMAGLTIDLFMDLSKYHVKELPATINYIPDFIDENDEKFLLDRIYRAPKPKWTQLSRRRLQNWGGLPHEKGMAQEIIPEWLDKYIEKVHKLGMFDEKRPNHVLVNEYLPGQGIMPHTDGPIFSPIITTISLESYGILDFYHRIDTTDNIAQRYHKSILLQPRSLLIVKDDAYHEYLHGIREINEDKIDSNIITHKIDKYRIGSCIERGKRVSLTIRHVPKVLKLQLQMGKWIKNV